jgi:hypothetical protein
MFACGLLALSCGRERAPRGAVEVARTRANEGANANMSAPGGDGGRVETARPLPVEAQASPVPDSPIRRIDFENFSYPFPERPHGRKKIRLRDGEQPPTLFGEHGIPHNWGYILSEVSYGDLTGDDIEEAIVILGIISSGSGIPNYVYIYTLRHGRPALLWSFETGDRADGGLQKVAAENGELLIELRGRNKVIGTDLYADDGTGKGDCCHDAFTRTRYRWLRGRFRHRGTPEVIFIDAAPTPPSPPS